MGRRRTDISVVISKNDKQHAVHESSRRARTNGRACTKMSTSDSLEEFTLVTVLEANACYGA